MDVTGALSLVNTAVTSIKTASTQTTNLQTQFYDAYGTGGYSQTSLAYGSGLAANLQSNWDATKTPKASGRDKIGVVASSITNAYDSVNLVVTDTLSCAAIDAIFSRFWTGLCNGTVVSAAGIARILIAAGVLLLIQLGIGVDLCCYHPGDPRSWTGGDAGTVAPKALEDGADKGDGTAV